MVFGKDTDGYLNPGGFSKEPNMHPIKPAAIAILLLTLGVGACTPVFPPEVTAAMSQVAPGGNGPAPAAYGSARRF